jgi:UDP-N-acetylmuramoyl-L-alanyl-D-glutamate--2,6-diaminopimelate ligase
VQLTKLLSEAEPGGPLIDIVDVTADSRSVRPGSLYVAVRGTKDDGHEYVADAIERGAAAVVVERPVPEALGVPAIQVASTREALARAAARLYGEPGGDLSLIGFTGTFGKTTTSEVLRAVLGASGARAGVLGSLGVRYGVYTDRSTALTTPGPVELHRALRRLLDAGADTVIVEITSHALRLGRVIGLELSGGIIAAILPGEHTDFHRSYTDYIAAKRTFLDYLKPGAVLAFDSDNRAARLLAADANVRVTAGLTLHGHPRRPEDLAVTDIALDADGALLTVRGVRIRSALLGRANVRNVGLALTFALASGVDLSRIPEALGALRPLPRRMQRFTIAGRTVLDDTAAHPDSFNNVFEAASLIPHERLIAAYVIRGSRGGAINTRNAHRLAELSAIYDATMIVSAAADVTGPQDRATPEEIDAARAAFGSHGCPVRWHDDLADAMSDTAAIASAGDLVLLIGAQGMNEGARLLREHL